jgi:thiol:disulfide interchange protein DsbD
MTGNRRGRRTAWLTLGLVLAWAVPVGAQMSGGGASAPPPKAETLVKASAAPVSIIAGGRAEVPVKIQVASGWHINANPPSPEYMIPTTLTLAGAAGVALGKVSYPAGQPMKLAFDENRLSVYSGEFTAKVALAAGKRAVNGKHALQGKVRFQACNDQVCLAPARVPFTLEVTVTGGVSASAAAPESLHGPPVGETPASGAAPGAPATIESGEAQPPGPSHLGGAQPPDAGGAGRRLLGALAQGGLGWFLALFVGGLALNLTPCVFPMLGVTVSVFGARRRERPMKVIAHALAYVLGIAITYSLLGLVAALTGGLFGAALQSPWVSIGLGVLFVVLSLSMFGLYEMQPPPWLLQRLGGADVTSLLGIFLSGLAVGIIAAPCVGPFVVAVLALLAQRGDALFGFQTMFVMSLGLGLPYLFLALFSNLLQSLPRSGDWMLWVKQVFGVLLAGIGLNFVLVGLAPQFAAWVLPVALILGGLFLGFVSRHGAAKPGFRRLKWAVGIAAVAGGIVAGMALRVEGVRFQPYDEQAVQAALAGGKPVMLDFSAVWCAPCHELDRYTFTDRRVIERARDFAAFKVDLTRYDSPGSKALRDRFGVTGVPQVLFFTPAGQEVRAARVIGFLPPGPFLERMEFVARGGGAAE